VQHIDEHADALEDEELAIEGARPMRRCGQRVVGAASRGGGQLHLDVEEILYARSGEIALLV
jgi:hypothetical protein